ncbi:hypothetical protein CERSUDRAFT_115920 [Gelatoporia subvermispora B]|uniref:Transmembrane protein n=1 Tax=Ceriporiopsis subvermispora (strain B) TaxID=914234 RepID=M2PIJ5_CERS8|nr:hypothetical protein CERSUDRAFT_115920 [Gelatoporia subvermispora B]
MPEYNRRSSLPLFALLATLSSLPSAQARCFFDRFGVEHCSLSTGARIGIAVAAIVAFIAAIGLFYFARQRRNRQINSANAAYIQNGTPPPFQPPYNNAQPAYNAGYTPQGGATSGYFPNSPQPGYDAQYSSQYPPNTYAGYNPQSGFAHPQSPPQYPQYPQYAPPPGVPPYGGKETA